MHSFKDMPYEVDITSFQELHKTIPTIDVRSPSEYQKGHIPGALNMPLFSDEERARIGTLYVKRGKEDALLHGFEVVGPKLKYFCQEAIKLASDKKLLIHCWRGGMRSKSMAWLFEQMEIETYVLKGGYKSYRRFILNYFDRRPNLIILGGLTGSGKTEILREIQKNGLQVIDLEAIACHKGSAFGALGHNMQPTQEQFENILYSELHKLDYALPIWMEDESISIGRAQLPNQLFEYMKKAPVVCIAVDKQTRIRRLVKEYSCFPHETLAMAVKKIEKRLGGEQTRLALEALSKNDYYKVTDITLRYYDKAYQKQIAGRDPKTVFSFSPKFDKPAEIAKEIESLTKSIF